MGYNWRIIRKVGDSIQIINCLKQGVSFNAVTSDTIQKYDRISGWKTTQQGEIKIAK